MARRERGNFNECGCGLRIALLAWYLRIPSKDYEMCLGCRTMLSPVVLEDWTMKGMVSIVLSQQCLLDLLSVILLSSRATVPHGAVGAAENMSMSICEKFPGTQKLQQNT